MVFRILLLLRIRISFVSDPDPGAKFRYLEHESGSNLYRIGNLEEENNNKKFSSKNIPIKNIKISSKSE